MQHCVQAPSCDNRVEALSQVSGVSWVPLSCTIRDSASCDMPAYAAVMCYQTQVQRAWQRVSNKCVAHPQRFDDKESAFHICTVELQCSDDNASAWQQSCSSPITRLCMTLSHRYSFADHDKRSKTNVMHACAAELQCTIDKPGAFCKCTAELNGTDKTTSAFHTFAAELQCTKDEALHDLVTQIHSHRSRQTFQCKCDAYLDGTAALHSGQDKCFPLLDNRSSQH